MLAIEPQDSYFYLVVPRLDAVREFRYQTVVS
jgi:hypothetical protein